MNFNNGQRAPLTPMSPGATSIGRTNAATPSLDPQSLRAIMSQSPNGMGGISPQMLQDPQFLAMLQQMMSQQPGQRRGFSGSLFGSGPAPTQT